MAQSVTDLFGAGSSLVDGILMIDFTDAGRTGDGVDTPASISPTKAASVITKKLGSLTAANADPTAAIAAQETTTTPQYIATRGGTAVTQLRKSTTLYEYYSATDPTSDPDNLI